MRVIAIARELPGHGVEAARPGLSGLKKLSYQGSTIIGQFKKQVEQSGLQNTKTLLEGFPGFERYTCGGYYDSRTNSTVVFALEMEKLPLSRFESADRAQLLTLLGDVERSKHPTLFEKLLTLHAKETHHTELAFSLGEVEQLQVLLQSSEGGRALAEKLTPEKTEYFMQPQGYGPRYNVLRDGMALFITNLEDPLNPLTDIEKRPNHYATKLMNDFGRKSQQALDDAQATIVHLREVIIPKVLERDNLLTNLEGKTETLRDLAARFKHGAQELNATSCSRFLSWLGSFNPFSSSP